MFLLLLDLLYNSWKYLVVFKVEFIQESKGNAVCNITKTLLALNCLTKTYLNLQI